MIARDQDRSVSVYTDSMTKRKEWAERLPPLPIEKPVVDNGRVGKREVNRKREKRCKRRPSFSDQLTPNRMPLERMLPDIRFGQPIVCA